MVGLHGLLERGHVLVNVLRLHEDFRGTAPDHHEAVELVLLLELADVLANLLGEIELVLPFLDVRALNIFHIIAVKRGRHGFQALQELFGLGQVLRAEHARVGGGLIGIVRVDVPAAEDEVVEAGQTHELLDFRHARLRAFSQANGAHLRERAYRNGFALPYQFHTRHERGAHRSHPRREHAEFSFWRSNTYGPAHAFPPI